MHRGWIAGFFVLLLAVPAAGAESRGRVLADFGFQQIRLQTVFDTIDLKVPSRWSCEQDEGDGRWWCGEPGIESGDFYVDYNLWKYPGIGGEKQRRVLFKMATRNLKRLYEDGEDRENIQLTQRPDAWVLSYDSLSNEAGEDVVAHNCHRIAAVPNGFLLYHLNLVVLRDLSHREDFRRLRSAMRNQCLDPGIDINNLPPDRE